MSFDTSWDIDKYRSEHESEEHWQFRRQFLLKHKDKYPEDRVVCLAQTFFNVEFLGCRYPPKVMDLIEELSKGLADDLREKRKGKLQRTFVSASDAAEAKAKGNYQSSTMITNIEQQMKNSMKFSTLTPYHPGYILPGFMLLDANSQDPIEVFDRSCSFCNIEKPKVLFDKSDPMNVRAELIILNVSIASGSGTTEKTARKDVFKNAYNKLKDLCYTIKVKKDENVFNVNKTDIISNKWSAIKIPLTTNSEDDLKDVSVEKDNSELKLPENGVGIKLLRMMGWKEGSGLGKNGQGCLEPIEIVQHKKYAGFDYSDVGPSPREIMYSLQKAVKKCIIAFKESKQKRLTFSTEFTKDERRAIHLASVEMGFKTKSYGQNEERYIVIDKKQNAREVFEELMDCGLVNEHYILIPPKNQCENGL